MGKTEPKITELKAGYLYIQETKLKTLDFVPKKTAAEFKDNYAMHDIAGDIIRAYMKQRHIKVIDYADDKRDVRVWEAGYDKPDAIIWNPELQLAFIDWKGHNTRTWILNQRAYNSYIRYSEKYQIPIFCIWA